MFKLLGLEIRSVLQSAQDLKIHQEVPSYVFLQKIYYLLWFLRGLAGFLRLLVTENNGEISDFLST